MDKTAELLDAFGVSGLDRIFKMRKLTYFESYPPFSKLLLEGNAYRIRSLEIVVPKEKAQYFRITYHPDAPDWLKLSLSSFSGFFACNNAGSNFSGSPLQTACDLVEIIKQKM